MRLSRRHHQNHLVHGLHDREGLIDGSTHTTGDLPVNYLARRNSNFAAWQLHAQTRIFYFINMLLHRNKEEGTKKRMHIPSPLLISQSLIPVRCLLSSTLVVNPDIFVYLGNIRDLLPKYDRGASLVYRESLPDPWWFATHFVDLNR